MRLMLLGDVHGSITWVRRAIEQARRGDLDGIVQLGDFGFASGCEVSRRFVAEVEQSLAAVGMPMWFLRGNHDDVDALHEMVSSAERDAIGACVVAPHLRYLPCGTVWRWGDLVFGALGGAFSVNRAELVEGSSWWPGEVVSTNAVDALAGRTVDVLLTHEAPLSSSTIWDRYADRAGPAQPHCEQQRSLVDQAMRLTGARWLVHGHHHVAYGEHVRWRVDPPSVGGHDGWSSTEVVGLGCESWVSMATVDTRRGAVEHLVGAGVVAGRAA